MEDFPTFTERYQYAKSFTEIAMQNNLIKKHDDPKETAKEIAEFFNTLVANLDKSI